MTYPTIGSRYRFPGGREVQVLRDDEEDDFALLCAPVIGGVLSSEKHQLLTLSARFVMSGVKTR